MIGELGNGVMVLWTGGWDSTFRVLQLVFVEGRTVQPISIVDPYRESTAQEFRAMADIANAVESGRCEGVLFATQLYLRTAIPRMPRFASGGIASPNRYISASSTDGSARSASIMGSRESSYV